MTKETLRNAARILRGKGVLQPWEAIAAMVNHPGYVDTLWVNESYCEECDCNHLAYHIPTGLGKVSVRYLDVFR